MIIYDNSDKEDLKLGFLFDNPQDAVIQISEMLSNIIMGTCHIYLNDKKQEDILDIVVELTRDDINGMKSSMEEISWED